MSGMLARLCTVVGTMALETGLVVVVAVEVVSPQSSDTFGKVSARDDSVFALLLWRKP